MRKLVVALLPLSILLSSCDSFDTAKKQIVLRVSGTNNDFEKSMCALAGREELEKRMNNGWKIKTVQVLSHTERRHGNAEYNCVRELYVLEK